MEACGVWNRKINHRIFYLYLRKQLQIIDTSVDLRPRATYCESQIKGNIVKVRGHLKNFLNPVTIFSIPNQYAQGVIHIWLHINANSCWIAHKIKNDIKRRIGLAMGGMQKVTTT